MRFQLLDLAVDFPLRRGPLEVHNVLAFPGVFRGALNVLARAISPQMQLAAAHALAGVVEPRITWDTTTSSRACSTGA